ncbi:MAG: 2-oxo acid dehydrogenase subunit E2 [Victivallaceae bacterium]
MEFEYKFSLKESKILSAVREPFSKRIQDGKILIQRLRIMVFEIIIPQILESGKDVTISSLMVPQGGFIKENQGILKFKSGNINQSVYAPCDGTVHWNVKAGDTVIVGTVVGTVDSGSSKIAEEVVNDLVEEVRVVEHVVEPDSMDAKIIKIPVINEGLPCAKNFILLKKHIAEKNESCEKMTPVSKTVAKRLVESLETTTVLTTFNEINMETVMLLRRTEGEKFLKTFGVKLDYMSFFIKAVTEALKDFPKLNAYIEDNNIIYRKSYNIGVAIETDKGLSVPLLKECDKLSQGDIESQLADLADKARNGKLFFGDSGNRGFMITDAGVYGSLFSTPILNPLQVGVLGMHKIERRPVVIDNQIVIANMMYVALSYDYRVIDSEKAVSFLIRIKERIEKFTALI